MSSFLDKLRAKDELDRGRDIKCIGGSCLGKGGAHTRKKSLERLQQCYQEWPGLTAAVCPGIPIEQLSGGTMTNQQPSEPLDGTEPFHLHVARKYVQLYESAARRNKKFDLALKDVARVLTTKHCYYTGVLLTRKAGNYQRTIDRVDNDKGYVSDNIVACSHLANQIKNELFERPTSDLKTNIEFVDKLVGKLLALEIKV